MSNRTKEAMPYADESNEQIDRPRQSPLPEEESYPQLITDKLNVLEDSLLEFRLGLNEIHNNLFGHQYFDPETSGCSPEEKVSGKLPYILYQLHSIEEIAVDIESILPAIYRKL